VSPSLIYFFPKTQSFPPWFPALKNGRFKTKSSFSSLELRSPPWGCIFFFSSASAPPAREHQTTWNSPRGAAQDIGPNGGLVLHQGHFGPHQKKPSGPPELRAPPRTPVPKDRTPVSFKNLPRAPPAPSLDRGYMSSGQSPPAWKSGFPIGQVPWFPGLDAPSNGAHVPGPESLLAERGGGASPKKELTWPPVSASGPRPAGA